MKSPKFLWLFIVVLFYACSGSDLDERQEPQADNQQSPIAKNVAEKGDGLADSKIEDANAVLDTVNTVEKQLPDKKEEKAEVPKTEKSSTKKKKRRSKSKRKSSRSKDDDTIEELKHSAKGRAIMDFNETIYDFGVIKQGEQISHDFVFENTGDGDLEIVKVDVTCGCTTPTYPFLPIAPGDKGTISITYNSTGKLGVQKPMITIVTNAKPRTHKIYLKGVVDAERANSDAEKTQKSDGKR